MTDFPLGVTEDMTAEEALQFTIDFLGTSPDDSMLCAAALTIGEPLVDRHWEAIEQDFLTLLAQRADVRRMVSCCNFDDRVPELVRERFYSYVTPEDDIGR